MTPRGSISSVMSTGMQNFVYNADIDSEEEKEDDEVVQQNNFVGLESVIDNSTHSYTKH